MEDFFKLIIYIIITAFWIISNLKKQSKREEKIPDFPEEPSYPKKDRPKTQPAFDAPLPEGISESEQIKTADKQAAPPSPQITFDEYLPGRRQETQMKRQRKKQKKPLKPSFEGVEYPEPKKGEKKEQILRPVTEEKPALTLNSSIKEGIIWSIILGPPRSKRQFCWGNTTLTRQI